MFSSSRSWSGVFGLVDQGIELVLVKTRVVDISMARYQIRNLERIVLHSLKLIGVLATFILPTTVLGDNDYQRGEHIEPAYEGWWQNEDGTFSLVFGYMNENWAEEIDVPIGEENFFSPGEMDRGQPTHFLPRRNRFTFEVVVPADWGDREVVWTLTSNGKTRKAYASILPDYVLDDVAIASETGSLGGGTSSPESRSNTAPVSILLGDTVEGGHVRSVRRGEPLVLTAKVTDDGLPKPRATTDFLRRMPLAMRLLAPPSRITVSKFNGLFHSWSVYRGSGKVTFDPPQVKVWEDTRPSANSPWSAYWNPPAVPEDGLYETAITFHEPGTYLLWGRADDGALYNDQYVTVNVSP